MMLIGLTLIAVLGVIIDPCLAVLAYEAWQPSGTLYPFLGSSFPYKVTNPKKGFRV